MYSVRRDICKGYWEMLYRMFMNGKRILRNEVGNFVQSLWDFEI